MSNLFHGKRSETDQLNNFGLGKDICRIDYISTLERETELVNMTTVYFLILSYHVQIQTKASPNWALV